jgi:prepilin-type N-terminal cleavage/methylation domain-containing protein
MQEGQMRDKTRQARDGFTLIELLTVVAIISMLIAIFGAGIRKVKISQRNLQQKAVFHGIEVGLHLFSNEFDGYPDSAQVVEGSTVTGAQRLAEALLGRDEQGFHPRTRWHPARDWPATAPHPGQDLYTPASKTDRKPQYVDLKRTGVHTIHDLWDGSNGTSVIYDSVAFTNNATIRSPVITDVFNRNFAANVSEKVGMPILYFKADAGRRFRVNQTNQPVHNPADTEYRQWAYNFDDNIEVLKLPWLRDPTSSLESGPIPPHYPDEDGDGVTDNFAQVFYESITKPSTVDNWHKPFNPDTFILISAGWDGIYGTKDDITNFNY